MFFRHWSPLVIIVLAIGIQACAPAEYAMPLETAPDTLRVAVLPVNMGGLDNTGRDEIWGPGIRGLLLILLENNPLVKVVDRGVSPGQESHPFAGGAPFVIMGSYLMHDENSFESLELRMMNVETGGIVARAHVNRSREGIEDAGNLILSFLSVALERTGMEAPANQDLLLPCSGEGFRMFASAMHDRDRADESDNPNEKAALLETAVLGFSESRMHFCKRIPDWLERTAVDTEMRRDLARASLDTIE